MRKRDVMSGILAALLAIESAPVLNAFAGPTPYPTPEPSPRPTVSPRPSLAPPPVPTYPFPYPSPAPTENPSSGMSPAAAMLAAGIIAGMTAAQQQQQQQGGCGGGGSGGGGGCYKPKESEKVVSNDTKKREDDEPADALNPENKPSPTPTPKSEYQEYKKDQTVYDATGSTANKTLNSTNTTIYTGPPGEYGNYYFQSANGSYMNVTYCPNCTNVSIGSNGLPVNTGGAWVNWY